MSLREIIAQFDVGIDQKKIDAAKKGIDAAADAVRGFGKLLAGAAIVGAVRGFVSEITQTDAALLANTQRLNMSAREFQQWTTAGRLAGVQAGDMESALGTVKKALDQAAVSGSSSASAFAGLGINLRTASGHVKPTNQVMREAVGALLAIPEPARRSQKAVQVFGESGAKLAPLLNKGRDGVNQLLGELDKLGGGASAESLAAVQKYNEEMVRWDVASQGLKSTLATNLMPILSRFATGLTKLVATINNSEEGSKRLKTALQTLGAIALLAGVKMVAPYIATLIAIGAVILIVDDLKTALEGGDSATAALLDKLFGKGAGKSFFQSVKKDLDDYRQAASKETDLTGKAIAVIEEFLSKVGEDLVRFFVDDLPAAISQAKKELGEKVRDTILEAVAKAQEAVNKKVAEFKQIGKDMVNGLVEGIKDVTGLKALEDASKTTADLVKETIQKTGEAHSPWQSTKREGRNAVLGLANGIREERGAEQAIRAQVASVIRVAAMSPAAGRSVNASSVHHNQITIHGTGAAAVRAGVSQAAEDDRRAALAALEAIS